MIWLKRFFAFIGFITVILVGLGFYIINNFTTDKPVVPLSENQVLTYNLKGDLSEKTSSNQILSLFKNSGLSLKDFIDTLDYAADDKTVSGMIVRLDHAHMSIAKIQEVHAALKRFRAKGKFAIAHADTYGESGNGTGVYYLASAFDEIALQPLGTLNFIGFSSELPFLKKLFDDVGVEPRFERREEYKSFVEMYTNYTISPENHASMQRILDRLMQRIIADVSQERGIRFDEMQQLVDKAPYHSAADAQKLGLIDHVYYLDECENHALSKAGSKAELVSLEDYADRMPENTQKDKPVIALIYGCGDIMRVNIDDDVPFLEDNVFNSEDTKKAFEQALDDSNVKAIVMRINSPGGSPVASETIAHQIEQAQQKGLPVIVYMSEYAASGGYWIACGADKIVAQPGTITGSIGVFGGKFLTRKLWDKIGVSWGVVKSGNNASMDSMNEDFSPEQVQKNNAQLDFIYDSFIKRVAQKRHLSYDEVHKLAKGQIWTGDEALTLKLVDKLGDMQDAIALAKLAAKLSPDQAISIQDFPRKKSKIDHLLSLVNGDININKLTIGICRFNPQFKLLWQMLLTPGTDKIMKMPEHTPIH